MPKSSSRLIVTVLFVGIYVAFIAETLTLLVEFGPYGLGINFATLFAHNFLFFPIIGLLALVAFWRPTTIILDALLWQKVKHGRLTLAIVMAGLVWSCAAMAGAFNGANTRSLFEVAPAALIADKGVDAANPADRRASIREILIKMKVNANTEQGLTAFRINCHPQWVQFAVSPTDTMTCFPSGNDLTIEDCCKARTAFRAYVNAAEAAHPSRLASVHRIVLPIKMFFLFLLLVIGVILVRLRARLTEIYGTAIQEVSFPIALGGALMLLWPLLNASYLDTFALLTADGSSNVYRVSAPLYALGFAIWAMLLIFYHLRTYPSQMEMALKFTGVVVATLGVLRYEQIISYLTRSLGVGGGIVAIVVFTAAIGALIATLVLGIKPPDFLDPPPPQTAKTPPETPPTQQ